MLAVTEGWIRYTATLVQPGWLTCLLDVDDWDNVCDYVRRPDRRFTVAIPELIDELRQLAVEPAVLADERYPFVLSASERRSFTANTIFRDPTWRRSDPEGALRINPQDAARLGLANGRHAQITTEQGSAVASVEITEMMQPGHISLPNGYGLSHPDRPATGVAPNELTGLNRRDPIAGTPWHKNVPADVTLVPDTVAVPAEPVISAGR